MVKVYLVTRLTRNDYSFLLLDNTHPTVAKNDTNEHQMLCVNKADFDRAISLNAAVMKLLKAHFEAESSEISTDVDLWNDEARKLLKQTEEFLKECK